VARVSLRSVAVRTGTVFAFALGTAACAAGDPAAETDADYSEVCQDADRIRVDDADCENNVGGTSVVYIPRASGYHPPPVGSRIDQALVTTVRPAAGSIARPPATGGFGRFTASGG
jgi:hypothetical protein